MFAYCTLRRFLSFLMVMKSSMSGWSTRIVSMSAPRRPAWLTVFVDSERRFMNEVEPGDPRPWRSRPRPSGRRIERSVPTPPPVRYTIALSSRHP